jgi:hypothetical protein
MIAQGRVNVSTTSTHAALGKIFQGFSMFVLWTQGDGRRGDLALGYRIAALCYSSKYLRYEARVRANIRLGQRGQSLATRHA